TGREVGLRRGEAFGAARRIVVSGQRTADGRMAFGSRGRYLFGSAVPERFAEASRDYARVERILASFFPALRGCAIAHRWSGPVAVPRSWRPSVGVDRASGLAWAGGYVPEGLPPPNLPAPPLPPLILAPHTH